METLKEIRKCKECGEKLLGRSDQQCCGDQCRANYNRRLRAEKSRLNPEGIAAIQKTILHNYNILWQLQSLGESVVEKATMCSMGFHFGYITNIVEKNGSIFYFCFNKGYIAIGNDVLIMDRSELID